jgi:hypothetical protein
MKDLTISITNVSNNRLVVNFLKHFKIIYFILKSNSINPLCDTNNSSSNTIEPISSSAGWGVYGNQQTWADLHLR